MCRLFGFRSVILSQVHSSLTVAENALVEQSEDHPDGWGVAYYLADAPHIVKSVQTAINDNLFTRVSGIVSSQTVIAHLRKATVGQLSIINTHPFQYGKWVFAHNGNLKNFDQLRPQLVAMIDPDLQRYVLGTTDSEVIFFILMSKMRRISDVHSDALKVEDVAQAAATCVRDICAVVGEYCRDDDGDRENTFLSFLLTNGQILIGHQGGKRLFYSTYKTRCGERDSCAFFAPACEAPPETGTVNHLVFSSEPILSENVWLPMQSGQIIGVDGHMKLFKSV